MTAKGMYLAIVTENGYETKKVAEPHGSLENITRRIIPFLIAELISLIIIICLPDFEHLFPQLCGIGGMLNP